MELRIHVEIVPEIEKAEKTDALASRMQEMNEVWQAKLLQAEADKQENMLLDAYELSEKPSVNFQVIGAMFRAFHIFQVDHEYPRNICIRCGDKEAAKQYKQIYNYFIPATKQERMPDDGWD